MPFLRQLAPRVIALLAGLSIVGSMACGGEVAGQVPDDANAEDSSIDAREATTYVDVVEAEAAPVLCDGGMIACAGQCVDATSDGKNCGRCGHDCLGGDCVASTCKVVVLWGVNQQPNNIAVDATSFYWTNGLGGMVNGCAKDTCAGNPKVFVKGDPMLAFFDIAVNKTDLFWTSSAGVFRCAVGGCGGNPTQLASGPASFVAIDATNVYWGNSFTGEVLKCALGGCGNAPTVLATGKQYALQGLTIDASNVYWVTSDGNVLKCAKAGCGGTPTTLAASQGYLAGVAVDGTNVYWSISETNGRVVKCAIGGCNGTPTTLASGQPIPNRIVVDGPDLYWTNTGGGIATCAINGCVPKTLWSAPKNPAGIAVDSVAIYWVNHLSGEIMKLAK